MIITKELINLYLGYDYTLSDVVIHFENGESTIAKWNIADKPQPTIAELEVLQPQVEAQENIEKILAQIIELDSKRSRAFFEPAEKEVGLTWLEYYNQEITKLRNKLI